MPGFIGKDAMLYKGSIKVAIGADSLDTIQIQTSRWPGEITPTAFNVIN